MKTLLSLCLGLTLAGAAGALAAADIAHGETLHDENCTSCHDSGVYTRKDRKVTTLAGLDGQVRRCELTLGLQWFDDDVEAVVGYLNDTYYKFR